MGATPDAPAPVRLVRDTLTLVYGETHCPACDALVFEPVLRRDRMRSGVAAVMPLRTERSLGEGEDRSSHWISRVQCAPRPNDPPFPVISKRFVRPLGSEGKAHGDLV